MNILITGGSGFVGSNLIDACSNQDNFRVVFRSESQVEQIVSQGKNLEIVILDSGIDSKTVWCNALKDIETVIHLAGVAHGKSTDSSAYYQVNTEGTLALAKQASENGIKRFVYVSTIGVLGSRTVSEPFNTNSVPNPQNDYAISKYQAELGLMELAKQTNLEVVIVRPALVYGDRAPGNFGAFIKLIKFVPFLPFGLAVNKRDFISVHNLVDLLLVCAKHPNASGKTFLASENETVSIREFSESIAEGLGKKVIQLPIPIKILFFFGKLLGKTHMVEQLFGNLQIDSSKLKDILGWVPPFTMKQSMASLRKVRDN